MPTRLHDRLNQGPLVVAEGFVFELERSCLLQAGAFVPTAVLEHPMAVRQLTDRFIDSGSDVVLALTYYTNADKLRLLGMEGRLEEINRAALTIATDAAADATARYGRSYLVAGNICNTYEFEDFRDVDRYRRDVLPDIRRQVGWAREAGVDYVVGETYHCLDEARLHLQVIKEAGLPAVITLSARGDRTPEGISYEEACRILWEEGADVVGLNCTRGPATMLPILEGVVKLARRGGLVAFSVRENRLGRYDDAIGALHARGIWAPVERFRVEDTRKDTSPHIVLIERVIDDPVARFNDVEQFFYRLPSAH